MKILSKFKVERFHLVFLFLVASTTAMFSQEVIAIDFELKSNGLAKSNSDIQEYILPSDQIEKLRSQTTYNIDLSISISQTKKIYVLKPYELLTDDFILTADNKLHKTKSEIDARFFIGSEKNNVDENISMSIIDNKLLLNIKSKGETYELSTLKNTKNNHVLKLERIAARDFDCISQEERSTHNFTPNSPHSIKENKQLKSNTSVSPVDIYVETTYQTYLDHGSTIAGVNTFVNNLFNAVASLYNTIPVTIQVSQINVYTSIASDPYHYIFSDGSLSAGQKSSKALSEMSCVIGQSYNGRLAHLIHSTTGFSSNGIAQVPTCPNSNSYESPLYGTSTVYDNSINSQYLLAHEIGHNLSSPHTHACAWNGNNTAIDGCAPVEGSCAQPTNMSGTIMSYCSNGTTFHNQVKTKIGDFVNQCLQPLNTSCPMVQESDLTITVLSSTSIEITYNLANANFLFIQYREVGTNNWTCHNGCSSNGTTITLTGLTPNVDYEIAPSVYCTSGAFSVWPFSCPIILNLGSVNCPTYYSTNTGTPAGNLLPPNQLLSDDFETDGIIESNQIIGDIANPGGATNTTMTVVYDSGIEILLKEGFETILGVTYEAFIDGCGNLFKSEEKEKKSKN